MVLPKWSLGISIKIPQIIKELMDVEIYKFLGCNKSGS